MNILKEYKASNYENSTEYLVRETNKVRIRKIFSWYPMYYNKFSWFQNIDIQEKLYFYKIKEFDYYNYKFYWSKWKREWRIEKIL